MAAIRNATLRQRMKRPAAGQHLLSEDLDHVLVHTTRLWEALRGRNLFVTGGTGFFGRWLLETFAHANETLELGAHLVVLSRDPDAFFARAPHLTGNKAIRFVRGDVRGFSKDGLCAQVPAFPEKYGFVIHAGTESNSNLNTEDPLRMLDTIVQGTRCALDFAVETGADRFLFVSSGAVYGRQPPGMEAIPETYLGGPDPIDIASAYAEGKRVGELLCLCYARGAALQPVIARCFSFYGPHLPPEHQAMGNFIWDAIEGGPIRVQGDGSPERAYLYAADLAIWLWTLLFKGAFGRAYNVGSSASASIAEWAARVGAVLAPSAGVNIAVAAPPPAKLSRYVPLVTRAETELGVAQWISHEEGLRRTGRWLERSALAGDAVSS